MDTLPAQTPSGLAVGYCLHDDHWFLAESIRSFKGAGPVFAFVSRYAWDGSPGDWERCAEIAEAEGAEVVLGDWPEEDVHRRASLRAMRERGFRYLLIPDGDEVAEPSLLESLVKVARANLAERVFVWMDTYWKSPEYVIRPRENLTPLILLDLSEVRHLHVREYQGGRPLVLGPEHGVLHHLSYAGPDERILRKVSTWGHRSEVLSGWYGRAWLAWDGDRLLRNLHPTHPHAYGFAERIPVPEALAGCSLCGRERPPSPEPPARWPTVSVVIPLHGGEEEIRLCLQSLEPLGDLLHEVLVVDDASPDGAAAVAAGFPFVTLLKNEENLGFAGTCNRGYAASTGELVLFLNSDTVVPRAGLVRLVESLMESGSVGAAGPCSNEVGYHQRVAPTYTSLETLDLFAEDFAHRGAPDQEVDMLVGFCLLARRSALEEVGGAFDERFGRGLFEDNDLSYRLRRAGYRLRVASRAFVHHWGSRSLGRAPESPQALLERNGALFHEKWREDVECGFASHLSGDAPEPIRFEPRRHPDAVREELRELARLADVSLCMIVRNEERVLGECLRSAQGYFREAIVVDTGSTDRTREIAEEHGAKVVEFPWTESFSEARNVSLRHASGRWVFWMDADDTLPRASAEAILRAAASAPEGIAGFVVPVQFVEEGPGAGTRVDHVKLFRNLPGVSFEGRIHEQVLASLRPHGDIARVEGAVVLHSGYDTSPEGQRGKRERDERLLTLDLEERPGHPFALFNLGMTAHYNGDHEGAVKWLRQSIAAAAPTESHVRKAYALMGVSLRELGRSEEALGAFEEGLRAVGEDPELRFHLGLLLTTLGRLPEAREQYLLVQEDASGHFSSMDVGILSFKRFHNLGLVCEQMGSYLEARDWWRRAMAARPGFSPSALALFEAAMAAGDLAAAREAAEFVRRAEGPPPLWAELGARLAGALGEEEGAWLARAVEREPQAVGPRLLLARWLLDRGDERAAVPHLEVLERQGVAEGAFLLGVSAMRRGDFAGALTLMRRARELNPGHAQTEEQVEALERLLAEGGVRENVEK